MKASRRGVRTGIAAARAWRAAALVSLLVAVSWRLDAAAAGDAEPPPNIVIFLIDELRYDEIVREFRQPFVELPHIEALARAGASFRNFYAVSTICSPNRATLLTGQYPVIHGVVDNTDRSVLSHTLATFPRELQAKGYDTAFVGKWHMGNEPGPRPGFNYWAALPGQGRIWDPQIWKDGRLQTVKGYVTDVLTDEALAFLRRSRDKPFLLYLAHKAIHPDARQNDDSSLDLQYGIRYEGAPRHAGRYADAAVKLPPNAQPFTQDPPGKPVLARALARKRSAENAKIWGDLLSLDGRAETIRKRAEMLLAVDESVGRVMAELREQGLAERTLVIFTSDNGTQTGEFGLTLERRLPYEGVVHLPLIVSYGKWSASAGRSVDELALQVDIAPTILSAAGIEASYSMQGRSLQGPITRTQQQWRRSFLIEHAPDERPISWLLDMSFVAVRQDDFKLIHWLRYPDEEELYDLARDPYELSNLIADPRYRERAKQLRQERNTLMLEMRGLLPP